MQRRSVTMPYACKKTKSRKSGFFVYTQVMRDHSINNYYLLSFGAGDGAGEVVPDSGLVL